MDESRLPIMTPSHSRSSPHWNGNMDKIQLIVGNHCQNIRFGIDNNNNNNTSHKNNQKQHRSGRGASSFVDSVSLTHYLSKFSRYSTQIRNDNYNGKFSDNINLLCKKDKNMQAKCHCCMVTNQACLVPIGRGQMKSKLNIGLVNNSYNSNGNSNPILAIVATNRGTSAQIVTGTVYTHIFIFFLRFSLICSFV